MRSMKCDKNDLLLYAVTDRTWLKGRTLIDQVEECLAGGATFLQLREKELDEGAFLSEAIELNSLCRRYHVPFVINDNVSVALGCGAQGVHVGQHDLEASCVRSMIGEDKILGVSVQTVEQALRAEAKGADYLGVGAVFPTTSKSDADAVSLPTLRQICDAVSIPVVAIGGISEDNLSGLEGTGIAGVAVISAIFAQTEIKSAAARLFQSAQELFSDQVCRYKKLE